jgi:hypothetical protein
MAVLRQVCRNVKRWRDARMAMRWTGTAMLEAEKSFRRLKLAITITSKRKGAKLRLQPDPSAHAICRRLEIRSHPELFPPGCRQTAIRLSRWA